MKQSKTSDLVDFKAKKLSLNSLDKKRADALHKLDNAKFGWFHVRAIIVSGIGFFTDAYDLFIINFAMILMGCVYYKDNNNKIPVYIDTLVKASAQVGTLIGQLFFGILSDRLGRKKMYGVELIIIIVCTVASCFSSDLKSGLSIFAVLGFWRVLLGIGIGGDYPLSAVITSEFATTKTRGAMISAVFAMQGFGILTACIVTLVFLSIFKGLIIQNVDNLDIVWRLCIGFGCIPAFCAIYFRLTIPETPRYTIEINNDIDQAVKDVDIVIENNTQKVNDSGKQSNENKATFKEFIRHFKQWKNFKVLLGCSMCWFALDVAFYGINLNTSIIISSIGFSGNLKTNNTVEIWTSLYNNTVGNIIIALLGLVPGYWASVFLIDRIGRKPIQIIGFTVLTILFTVLSAAFNQIQAASTILFIAIFTLAQFFQNFGPNTTTFVIPGEVFTTRFRSTAHGICAASGKLGAIVSSVGFFQLKDAFGKPDSGIPILLGIFAAFMFIGLLFTFLIPETKGKSLEELSNENDDYNSDEVTSSM